MFAASLYVRRPQTALADSSPRENSTAGAGQKSRAGSVVNTTGSHASSLSASESTKVPSTLLMIFLYS